MKIRLRNGSTIETIDVESENIRSKRGEVPLQYYNQYIEEILKPFELKWYQRLYLKVIFSIKNKIYGKSRFYISSKYYRK